MAAACRSSRRCLRSSGDRDASVEAPRFRGSGVPKFRGSGCLVLGLGCSAPSRTSKPWNPGTSEPDPEPRNSGTSEPRSSQRRHNRPVARFTRRDFLTASAVAIGALPLVGVDRVFARQGSEAVFRHGVASGDPLRDRVVLWTRVTPGAPDATVDVDWMVARDARMSRVDRAAARRGRRPSATTPSRSTPSALEPGSTYYYRFAARGAQSPIGRTRTLPARPTRARPAGARVVRQLAVRLLQRLRAHRRARRSRRRAAPRRLHLRVRERRLRQSAPRATAGRSAACRFPIARS